MLDLFRTPHQGSVEVAETSDGRLETISMARTAGRRGRPMNLIELLESNDLKRIASIVFLRTQNSNGHATETTTRIGGARPSTPMRVSS